MLLLLPCVQDGWTILMEASKKGHLEVVQVLLAAGADKEAKSDVSGGAGVGGVPGVHGGPHHVGTILPTANK